jgi:hypothetical protein
MTSAFNRPGVNVEEDAVARPRLHVVSDRRGVDLEAAEKAVRDLVVALGRDPDSEHPAATPRRVAQCYAEMLDPEPFELTFVNGEGYDELVVARSASPSRLPTGSTNTSGPRAWE